ncbi:MAG: hypothetical protein EPN21_08740 [Methylococcaceae bacterium]|nr:MAG: hypothetical protein EPN21_08740 [Methylococcaceae bacterium]
MRYSLDFTNSITVIQINLNADLAADLEIQLTGLVGLSVHFRVRRTFRQKKTGWRCSASPLILRLKIGVNDGA